MARRGFREGHDYQHGNVKGLAAYRHPAESIPFFTEYDGEFQKRKKEIQKVWNNNQFIDDRLKLEKELLKLKGLRDACDCPSFAYQTDYALRAAFNLSSKTRRKYDDYMTYVDETEDSVKSYQDVMTTFRDFCTCRPRDGQPVTPAPHMSNERYKQLFSEEMNHLEKIYPVQYQLMRKDNRVFTEMMNAHIIRREMQDSVNECDSDGVIKLIYNVHISHLDSLRELSRSQALTQTERNTLSVFQQASIGSVIRQLRFFDRLCKCEPTKIHQQKYDDSKDIKELADNWKRRTLYRLGGD